MAHGPKQPQTIGDCKVKRVYPRLPLRVHSVAPKGFAGNGSCNLSYPKTRSGHVVCAGERRLEEAP